MLENTNTWMAFWLNWSSTYQLSEIYKIGLIKCNEIRPFSFSIISSVAKLIHCYVRYVYKK